MNATKYPFTNSTSRPTQQHKKWNIMRVVKDYKYNVLMANRMHNSYNKFLFHSFCLLYMFRTNLVVHHQEHGTIYCITQFGTIRTIVQARGEPSC